MEFERKVALIFAGIMTSLAGGLVLHSCHIKSKLEHDALHLGSKHNIVGFPDWSMNLPKIKNSDVDGDGKYESIILYENQNGEKIYQEIVKQEDGSLVLGEAKPYR